jgi:hypothetical protein
MAANSSVAAAREAHQQRCDAERSDQPDEYLSAPDPRRFFWDYPLIDRDAQQTYVLSNQWGTKTESVLDALARRFPEAKVGFRRAESS